MSKILGVIGWIRGNPLLNVGITVASFQSCGTAPVDMTEEYINDSGYW